MQLGDEEVVVQEGKELDLPRGDLELGDRRVGLMIGAITIDVSL